MPKTSDSMTLDQIVSELVRQRQWLDHAILCLSKVQQSRTRRGRPPKWLTEARENGLLEMDNPARELSQGNGTKQLRARTNSAAQRD